MRSPISRALESVVSVRERIWKKVLYHPLTWLAVGLHVALLVVPFNPAPPVVAEPEEETAGEKAIPIDLLNLSEIARSTPPADVSQPADTSPADTPPPSEAAPPAPALPPSPASPTPSTEFAQATVEPEAISEGPAEPPVETPPTGPTPAEPPPNTPPPPPPFDPGPQRGAFIQGLGDLGVADNSNLGMPLQSSFRRPENYGYFVAGPDQAALGARGAKWLDDERNDLVPVIQSTYAAQNLTLIEAGDYGGEALYELQSAEGASVMFVSIVELEGSSLLVLWNDNPVEG